MMSGVSNTQNLRALIADVRDREGWTYEEISRRSKGELSRSLVGKLAKDPHREDPPPMWQMKALAGALGIPLREVMDAVGRDAGFITESTPDVDVLSVIRQDKKLLPEARRHLINQYGLLLRVASTEPSSNVTPLDRSTRRAPLAESKDQPVRRYVARKRTAPSPLSDPTDTPDTE